MVEKIIDELGRAEKPQVLGLLGKYYSELYKEFWQTDARLYQAFAERLVSAGYPLRAFELLREGIVHHPSDLKLKYLAALASARGRSLKRADDEARKLVDALRENLKMQVDILSLPGRLNKDQYELSPNPETKAHCALQSARAYDEAFRETRHPFPGINAATMWLLSGNEEKARTLAAEVLAMVQRELVNRSGDYWLLASLAEAQLILGEQSKAAETYSDALKWVKQDTASVASMRRQLRLLRQKIPIENSLLNLFNLGCVVAFAGHMIDHPARELPPRFPPSPELEEKVSRAIAAALAELNSSVGYCSGACGSDLLFAEQILKKSGAELHIVLPYRREDFLRTSVDFGAHEMTDWRNRFEKVLERATEIHYATEEPWLGDNVLLEFVNAFTQGLTITHAERLWTEAWALAVIDPASEKNPLPGGTAEFLEKWEAGGHPSRRIDLAKLRSECDLPTRPAVEPIPGIEPFHPTGARRELKFMLFGDVKNFSRLGEENTTAFFFNYPEAVANLIKSLKPTERPVFQNTWGDGLFLVFDRINDCAKFALTLLEKIELSNLAAVETKLRIGLHAGPVYRYFDPIIGKENFIGSHVNRAARIEPVTVAGCAFTSEQFAAVLAVEPHHEFVCEYVGIETLAKDYDRCPLYRLRRK